MALALVEMNGCNMRGGDSGGSGVVGVTISHNFPDYKESSLNILNCIPIDTAESRCLNICKPLIPSA
ncbi:hypothetical protein Pcinc_031382 [Petrolisthes cinctipes]|uniref:Uncharacterized protein n=1 Tax=Petrolisthes cinctipes TaxID=88211 RepID=A0AAE1EWG3_PETCI|nr:hypothetical protein Pcinc_031382 [Petrolisthes cinctipes]